MKPHNVLWSSVIPPPTTGDPFWNDVVLLLSGDGVHGSDNFFDESPAAHGFGTANNDGSNVSVSTALKKFGTGSIRFDGTGDKIEYSDSNDWHFGTGLFTIDFWMAYDNGSINQDQIAISQYRTTGEQRSWFVQYEGTADAFRFGGDDDGTTGSELLLSHAFNPTPGQFYLHSIDRDASDNFRLYLDGVMMDKVNSPGFNFFNASTILRIGCFFSGGIDAQFLHGNMDELRITKNCRYGSDAGYALPTTAWPRGL